MEEASPSPAVTAAAAAILLPLSTAIVGLRFYARRKNGSHFGIDDWLTVPALLVNTGIGAGILAGVALHSLAYPTPPPTADGTSFQQTTAREIWWSIEIMQVLGLGFIKLSFLFFFRRVFVTNHSSITKLFGIVNMVMIILVALWTVAFLFAYIFICGTNPFAYYGRDQVYEKQRCVNTSALLDSFAASDLLGDIIILVMPIERVWRLHLSFRKKIAVSGVFALGILTVVFGALRLAAFVRIELVFFVKKVDVDLMATVSAYWSFLQVSFGLIACCLPVLPKLLKSTAGRGSSSSRTQSNSHSRSRTRNISTSLRGMISFSGNKGLEGSRSHHRPTYSGAESLNSEFGGNFVLNTTKARGMSVPTMRVATEVEALSPPPHGIVVTRTYGTEAEGEWEV